MRKKKEKEKLIDRHKSTAAVVVLIVYIVRRISMKKRPRYVLYHIIQFNASFCDGKRFDTNHLLVQKLGRFVDAFISFYKQTGNSLVCVLLLGY